MKVVSGAIALLVFALMPTPVTAATIAFSGAGSVLAGPCSPGQVDPAACFLLTHSTSSYLLNGDPGWTFSFDGQLVPNPENPYPFPTYIGAGVWSLTKGSNGLLGSWTNLFLPAAPPPGCDASSPFGDPDCWSAVSVALLSYVITSGTGVYAGASGLGQSTINVTSGFPPGNIQNPAAGSLFNEVGELRTVPEPNSFALLGLGLLAARRAIRTRPHRGFTRTGSGSRSGAGRSGTARRSVGAPSNCS
jgi:hypothetical protein